MESLRLGDGEAETQSRMVKSLVQVAAALVLALLVFPPAVAEGICLLASEGHASMSCCVTEASSFSSTVTPATMADSCTERCCSVAARNSSSPAIADNLKTEAVATDAPAVVEKVPAMAPFPLAPVLLGDTGSASDVQALLSTFRI